MIGRFKKQWLNQVVQYSFHNSRIILMTASLLLGVLIGSLVIRNSAVMQSLSLGDHFNQYVTIRSSANLLVIFSHSFFTTAIYLLLAYVLGLCLYGCIPSVLLPLFRGLGIGAVCGYIYGTYGLKGAAFALLLLLPFTFCYSLILLIGCREALIFSASMFNLYTKRLSSNHVPHSLKKYNIRFLVLLLFHVAVSIPDCLLTRLFINVFGF